MQNFLKKYDHIPHNEKSIKLLLAEEKFLKIKHFVEEEQTQPEYLQELLQNLLKDLQILNEIQPLKQEISKPNPEDQEEKKAAVFRRNERMVNQIDIHRNREYQKEEIDIDYRSNIQEAEELRKSEARARIQKIIVDDDDDNLGFMRFQSEYEHTPFSPNVEPKDLLIMEDKANNTTPKTETIIVIPLYQTTSEFDDFSFGEFEIVLDISKIVDILVQEILVESYLLIEKINVFSLSPPIPISPIFCPSSTIPVVDLDLPLEEEEVPVFRMTR
ncbi:hypothetical protein Tco_0568594 [Tanacetum coccineum]